VVGIDPDPDAISEALALGVLDEGDLPDSEKAAAWLSGGADLVVLATPAAAIESWFELLGELGYGGVVTDVASTKAGVLRAARRCLPSAEKFVGGHPMAGSERTGVAAARPDLFKGAYWILTPAGETSADAYSRVHAFVTALGARVVSVEPKDHDEAVAIVSHVPHVAAAALCDVAGAHGGEGGDLLRLAAGGFKDTTRIAAGSPELWAGICLENSEALASGIRELRLALGEFEAMVRASDAPAITAWLTAAAEVRRSLPAQWVPATERLTELTVPMVDRPGVVAEVTGAVSRAGCNIEGIDIDHETEDSALLVLVLTDEGDMESLARELTDQGYEPRFEALSEAATEEAAG
jgi:prephenate dehydrogenase